MAKDINLTSQEWCDIVFEKKNKEYGAYVIRRSSSKRHLIAIAAILIFAVFIAFLPFLIQKVVEATRPKSEGLVESTVLADLKTEDQVKEENIAHQQEAPPPPPLKSTIKFTPPVITATEEMKDEDRMKSQEELTNTKLQISVADVQGTEHGVDIADLKEHKVIVEDKKEEIFIAVEQMPEFPGGEKQMMEFIHNNLKYPEIAKKNGIEGLVYIQFVVNSRGEIGGVKVLRSVHSSLSEEAIRVVKSMPKWIPGKQNGINVSTYINIPISFKLR